MAWIKATNDTSWYKEDDKYSFIRVWKIGLSASERKRRGIKLYGVSGRIGMNGECWKKYFKTKPQAIAYVEAYLKKDVVK